MDIIKLCVGDVVELKKSHPCGNKIFRIIQVSNQMRILCLECSHEMTIERIKFERSIKKFIERANND